MMTRIHTGRGHKYNAVKTTVDGVTFDSKAEARRYRELKLLEAAAHITGLELQPEFVLQKPFKDATGQRHAAIKYRADFRYIDRGKVVIEDVKGYGENRVWMMKKKMFLYRYPEYELKIVG